VTDLPTQPWCRASRLLVAATAAWLAFTVLQTVLSGRWWLWLIPSALPPLAFVAVPVLLLGCLPLVRIIRAPVPAVPSAMVIVGSLAAAVAAWPQDGLDLTPPWASRGAVPAGSIRVFAWNTEYWAQSDDPDRFYGFLTSRHADVYVLQEYLHWDARAGLDGERQIDELPRLRREFPGYHIALRGELITLSRYPIVAAPPVGPERALPPGAAFPAVFTAAKVLRTDLLIGSGTLTVYNVHLPEQINLQVNGAFFRLIRERDAARRRQLDGLVADLAANPHPVLVAGDFNTSPAMGDINRVRGRLRDAAAADPTPYPASWPLGFHIPPLWRLDWAFTSSGVAVGRYRFADPRGLSDHRAQDIEISRRERR
jgi:endonuclease/exonuclease/phosphatase family metal-dependent hydrolase